MTDIEGHEEVPCHGGTVDVTQATHDGDCVDELARLLLLPRPSSPRKLNALLDAIEYEVRRTGRLSDGTCPICREEINPEVLP